MAFNEEANIGRLLESICRQSAGARIAQIIVVSSASTDRTNEVVLQAAAADPRIILIDEPERRGKSAAINRFLAGVPESIVVVASADLVLEPTAIEALVAPLQDPSIGMVGSHPVPLNERTTFVGFAVHLMWELHHQIAMREPKMGELTAFYNCIAPLDTTVLSDELCVEEQIRAIGLRIAYAPEAVVYNHGPQSLHEFARQRIRWNLANMQSAKSGMTVSTLDTWGVIRAAWAHVVQQRPRLDWVVRAALLEAWCRLRAAIILRSSRRVATYQVWEPLPSTKSLGAPE